MNMEVRRIATRHVTNSSLTSKETLDSAKLFIFSSLVLRLSRQRDASVVGPCTEWRRVVRAVWAASTLRGHRPRGVAGAPPLAP